MINIPIESLDSDTSGKLEKLQLKIDQKSTFLQKASKAQSSWDSKSVTTFAKVKDTLLLMNISKGICNYCEQNESNDIEHIEPKSFFPEKTFVWENYILACKQCNSGHKLDKCFVFDSNGDLKFLERSIEPSTKDVAFINPRTDDPNNYMILTFPSYQFEILEGNSQRQTLIAQKTIEILELNTRAVLVEARKNAANYYFSILDRLVRIRAVRTNKALKSILSPVDSLIDDTKPLNLLKAEITESYKNHIISYQHPSVWYSIKKISSIIDPTWKRLFSKIPEALNW